MRKKYQNYLIIKLIFALSYTNYTNCLLSYKKYKIYIDSYEIFVELAITPEERQKGLMYRKHLGENEGMLFIFPEKDFLRFWMKNTYIPLDIAFFDEDGYLLEVFSMKPQSEDIIQSTEPAKYALEMNQGWFYKKQIKRFSKLQLTKEVEEKINLHTSL